MQTTEVTQAQATTELHRRTLDKGDAMYSILRDGGTVNGETFDANPAYRLSKGELEAAAAGAATVLAPVVPIRKLIVAGTKRAVLDRPHTPAPKAGKTTRKSVSDLKKVAGEAYQIAHAAANDGERKAAGKAAYAQVMNGDATVIDGEFVSL